TFFSARIAFSQTSVANFRVGNRTYPTTITLLGKCSANVHSSTAPITFSVPRRQYAKTRLRTLDFAANRRPWFRTVSMIDGLRFAIGPCARASFLLERQSCAKAFTTLVSRPTNYSHGIFAANFESRAMHLRA